jgi:hypothetical protein
LKPSYPNGASIAVLKVKRAHNQFKTLERQLQRFQEAHQYTGTPEHDEQNRVDLVRFHAQAEPLPKLVWNVQIGEIVHNLRSSLDQLVWSLVEAQGINKPVERRTAFPVCLVESGGRGSWDDWGIKQIEGVGDKAAAIIRDHQPFKYAASNDPYLHKIHVLHWLWNGDKHRSPPLTRIFKQSARPTILDVVQGQLAEQYVIGPGAPLEEDTIIATWRVAPTFTGTLKVKVQFYVAATVISSADALYIGGHAVIGLLSQLGEEVTAIANALLPCFPSPKS